MKLASFNTKEERYKCRRAPNLSFETLQHFGAFRQLFFQRPRAFALLPVFQEQLQLSLHCFRLRARAQLLDELVQGLTFRGAFAVHAVQLLEHFVQEQLDFFGTLLFG